MVQIRVTSSRVLVVEGKDAELFFNAFLKALGRDGEIQVLNAGGITEIPKFIRALAIATGFNDVVSLGVIRDAEVEAVAAFRSVCGALASAQLPVPSKIIHHTEDKPRVSVFILPDCSSPGMLETLCLSAVRDDPVLMCAMDMLSCIDREGIDPPRNCEKALVHAYLACKPDAYAQVGRAAQKGYWHWDNQVFSQLRSFLVAL